jgi:hypothetical protein
MGQLREMSRKGDVKLSWNSDNEKEVAAAKEIFDKRIKEGWAAFGEKYLGCKGDRIRTFDPDAGRIVLVPPIAGG